MDVCCVGVRTGNNSGHTWLGYLPPGGVSGEYGDAPVVGFAMANGGGLVTAGPGVTMSRKARKKLDMEEKLADLKCQICQFQVYENPCYNHSAGARQNFFFQIKNLRLENLRQN